MEVILAGLGLTLVIEGLVLVLLPGRLEDVVLMLQNLPIETRRMLGLAAVAAGVVLVWLAIG